MFQMVNDLTQNVENEGINKFRNFDNKKNREQRRGFLLIQLIVTVNCPMLWRHLIGRRFRFCR